MTDTPHDVVAITDSSGNQVFSSARPIKARVKETAQLMFHPLANGSTFTDHIVFNPIEIDMHVVIDQTAYSQIKQLFISAALLTVHTKTNVYPNMLIGQMPHEEETEVFDKFFMGITFIQAILVNSTLGILPPSGVANKQDASTQNVGQKQAVAPSTNSYDQLVDWLSRKIG